MSDRFNVRSKCLTWPNLRSQLGVRESTGIKHNFSDGRILYDLTDPHEGRMNDDDYRRSNENNVHSCINDRSNEQGWQNEYCRDPEHVPLFDLSDEVPNNSPIRDYLYEDWDQTKNEIQYTIEE